MATLVRVGNLPTHGKVTRQSYIGIDFGTSTTVASFVGVDVQGQPLAPQPIPIRQLRLDGLGHTDHLVPSAIAYINGAVLIGHGAIEYAPRLQEGVNYWSSFKMQLGEDLGDQFYSSQLRGQGGLPNIVKPRHAASTFLRFVREGVETWLQENKHPSQVSYAVSIPASFEANQRADLLAALLDAGMRVEGQTLIDEPNAAFISYLAEASKMGEPLRVTPDGLRGLVFDYGAGTCDISVLEVTPDSRLGYASRNLAISRFANLGGDDVDYAVAEGILLPQVMEASGRDLGDFTRADLVRRILPQLKPAAQELKEIVCKAVANAYVSDSLPALAKSSEEITGASSISISLPQGAPLKLAQPKMSFAAFAKTCEPLHAAGAVNDCAGESLYGHRLLSIFNPVESALDKAQLTADDLDFVLLVGGSAANPYVQEALASRFGRRLLIIPRDLRAHVSQGAALHSYMLHGRGVNVIVPITSEPLLVATRGGGREVILAAGTPVSEARANIDDLQVPDDGQKIIEIPICVGSLDKVVANVAIHSESSFGFRRGDRVQLSCSLSADKVLSVAATVGNQQASATVSAPFSNSGLTPKERAVKLAEKAANDSAASNGGRPSPETLRSLARARGQAGRHREAAETYEVLGKAYPKHRSISSEAFHFDEAGDRDKSRRLFEEAFELNRSPTSAHNIAVGYSNAGNLEKAEEWHERALEVDPDYAGSQLALSKLIARKNPERARQLLTSALESLEQASRGNKQSDRWTWDALARAYERSGKFDLSEAARQRARELNGEANFTEANLVTRNLEGLVPMY